MARPRKYIQIDGRTIDGVSLHRATNRFYIYDRRGKQVYFRSWQEASEVYLRLKGDPVAVAKENARYAVRHAAMLQPDLSEKLVAMFAGDPRLAEVQLEVSHPDSRIRNPDGSFARDGLSIERFADSAGAPRFDVIEAASSYPGAAVHRRERAAVDCPKLAELGEAWVRHKMNEKGLDYVPAQERAARRAAKKRSVLTKHVRDTLSRWQLLVDCVGNIRITEMGPVHFRKFQEWADREASRKATGRWHQQLFTAVKSVFNHTMRRYPDWAWPAGISERIRAWQPKKYESSDHHAEPMPPEMFRKLLAQCDTWAATPLDGLDTTSQSGRGRRLQVIRKRREGLQLRAILKLAINCGLNGVDCERLRWSHLKLDAGTPHLDFARRKVAHSAGKPIERRIPLSPEVVRELEGWRAADSPKDDLVFHSARGTGFRADLISKAFARLRSEAELGADFDFRHLRNVGPSLASENDLPEEKIQHFLGHTPANTSARYKGAKKPEYLKPMVDLIGENYFGRANQ